MINLHGKPFYLNQEQIDWVENKIKTMSLLEKVGQLFCMNIRDFSDYMLDSMFDITEFGAVMFRECPLADALAFTEKLQKRSKIPALIAANLEKGGCGIVLEGTQVGSQLEVAATGDLELARKLATVCSREGAAAGANWAFAPILDIDFNFRNPITNVRTFGSNPDTVCLMSKAYVQEVQKNGMAACIKHFPGDGCDERDQHLCTTVNDLSCEEWNRTFGKVYGECIEAGALTCMVGHIMQPAYSRYFNPKLADEEILPGSLSKELMTDLLRGKLGFNGMICTDASTMNGYAIPMPRAKALPTSINAGADMILFSRNMVEDFNIVLSAVESEEISYQRLDEAVTRVLATKAALQLHNGAVLPSLEESQKTIGCFEHKAWAKECAHKAITLVKREPQVLPLSSEKTRRVLLCPIENYDPSSYFNLTESVKEEFISRLEREGFEVTVFTPDPSMEGFTATSTYYTENFDLCLYVVNLATKSNQTVVRIEWQQPMGADCPKMITEIPTVAVSMNNPYHLLDMPRVRTYINCYASNTDTLDALFEKLMGRSEFLGKNPVDPFCGKWDARL